MSTVAVATYKSSISTIAQVVELVMRIGIPYLDARETVDDQRFSATQ